MCIFLFYFIFNYGIYHYANCLVCCYVAMSSFHCIYINMNGEAFNKYCISAFSISTRNVNFVVVVNMCKYTYVEISIHSLQFSNFA